MNISDFKFVLAVIATIITVAAYIPYLRDIFLEKTKPHLYTWLIWTITQGTATVGLWYGGGKFEILSMIAGMFFVILIFFLCFKFGTKNINWKDTVLLVVVLFAVIVWWQLDNPLLAVFMVTTIDAIGYIPTLRKSFEEPWSETLSFWVTVAITSVLTILSSAQYNLLTVTYLAMLAMANGAVCVICFFRRKVVQK